MPSLLVATAPVWALPMPGAGLGHTTAPNCRPIGQIYASGIELCEKMWGTAFRYERNESLAYSMWFFDTDNPNDKVSSRLGKGDVTSCHLKGKKEGPAPMAPTLAECHPWRTSACCSQSEVASLAKLKQRLGRQFQWDRCGPLSQECERFLRAGGVLLRVRPQRGPLPQVQRQRLRPPVRC
ncbi:Folr1 [Symbiodinium natans]|uniref:Folr1 protein n=1 Tax=Symbiodinium natans TaxID=878477 RepID=A0A812S480_9DINO|nr:Folr1 [Symbiodinium natans]